MLNNKKKIKLNSCISKFNLNAQAQFKQTIVLAILSSSTNIMASSHLPSGNTTANHAVTINTVDNKIMNIHQLTESAIINWKNFSVAEGMRVDFLQPSNQAATLNRVSGQAASTIAGTINANGHVYLVNPNGITITPTGSVNAAAFIASQHDISDRDFYNRKLNFTFNRDQNSHSSEAGIYNFGSINIEKGGYAALLGANVENAGTISVPLGRVALASAKHVVLNIDSDQMLQVNTPIESTDNQSALISQTASGKILANNGHVEMNALALKEAVRQSINISGMIEVSDNDHSSLPVININGNAGKVNLHANLTASSQSAGSAGIYIEGRDIDLQNAKVSITDYSGLQQSGLLKILSKEAELNNNAASHTALDQPSKITIDKNSTISITTKDTANYGQVDIKAADQINLHGTVKVVGTNPSNAGHVLTQAKDINLRDASISFENSSTKRENRPGTWQINAQKFNLDDSNAPAIARTLEKADVTITSFKINKGEIDKTGETIGSVEKGEQDIIVSDPIQWHSPHFLKLDSSDGAIIIKAPLTVAGAGSVELNALKSKALPSGIQFDQPLEFIGNPNYGQSLIINGFPQKLVYSIPELQKAAGHEKYIAIAKSINAAQDDNSKPEIDLGTSKVIGLGNTLSGLHSKSTHTHAEPSRSEVAEDTKRIESFEPLIKAYKPGSIESLKLIADAKNDDETFTKNSGIGILDYANQLATKIRLPIFYYGKQVIKPMSYVIPVAAALIPTATFFGRRAIIRHLNRERVQAPAIVGAGLKVFNQNAGNNLQQNEQLLQPERDRHPGVQIHQFPAAHEPNPRNFDSLLSAPGPVAQPMPDASIFAARANQPTQPVQLVQSIINLTTIANQPSNVNGATFIADENPSASVNNLNNNSVQPKTSSHSRLTTASATNSTIHSQASHYSTLPTSSSIDASQELTQGESTYLTSTTNQSTFERQTTTDRSFDDLSASSDSSNSGGSNHSTDFDIRDDINSAPIGEPFFEHMDTGDETIEAAIDATEMPSLVNRKRKASEDTGIRFDSDTYTKKKVNEIDSLQPVSDSDNFHLSEWHEAFVQTDSNQLLHQSNSFITNRYFFGTTTSFASSLSNMFPSLEHTRDQPLNTSQARNNDRTTNHISQTFPLQAQRSAPAIDAAIPLDFDNRHQDNEPNTNVANEHNAIRPSHLADPISIAIDIADTIRAADRAANTTMTAAAETIATETTAPELSSTNTTYQHLANQNLDGDSLTQDSVDALAQAELATSDLEKSATSPVNAPILLKPTQSSHLDNPIHNPLSAHDVAPDDLSVPKADSSGNDNLRVAQQNSADQTQSSHNSNHHTHSAETIASENSNANSMQVSTYVIGINDYPMTTARSSRSSHIISGLLYSYLMRLSPSQQLMLMMQLGLAPNSIRTAILSTASNPYLQRTTASTGGDSINQITHAVQTTSHLNNAAQATATASDLNIISSRPGVQQPSRSDQIILSPLALGTNVLNQLPSLSLSLRSLPSPLPTTQPAFTNLLNNVWRSQNIMPNQLATRNPIRNPFPFNTNRNVRQNYFRAANPFISAATPTLNNQNRNELPTSNNLPLNSLQNPPTTNNPSTHSMTPAESYNQFDQTFYKLLRE